MAALATAGISWGVIAGGGHGGLHVWAMDGAAVASLPAKHLDWRPSV